MCLLPSCGGRAALDEPLAAIPFKVEAKLVEPAALRVEWSLSPPPLAAGNDAEEKPPTPTRSPAVDAHLVYVPYGDVVRAARVEDGSPLWSVHLPGPAVLPPVVVDSGIAVATARAWMWIDREGRAGGLLPLAVEPVDAASAGELLVFVDGAEVHAVRPPGGDAGARTVWTTPLPGATGVGLGPTRQQVVVTAGEQGVAALGLADGAIRWQRADTSVITARAAVGPRRAFVVRADSRIRALSLDDGDVDWTSRAIGVRVSGAPVLVDDIVWVAGLDAALHGYDAGSGSHLFRLGLSGRVYVDLVTWGRWVIASPGYGPWSLVRGPLIAVGPADPGAPRKLDIAAGGDLEIAPGTGPAGVAVVDASGQLRLLRPPEWARRE